MKSLKILNTYLTLASKTKYFKVTIKSREYFMENNAKHFLIIIYSRDLQNDLSVIN